MNIFEKLSSLHEPVWDSCTISGAPEQIWLNEIHIHQKTGERLQKTSGCRQYKRAGTGHQGAGWQRAQPAWVSSRRQGRLVSVEVLKFITAKEEKSKQIWMIHIKCSKTLERNAIAYKNAPLKDVFLLRWAGVLL